MGLLPGATGQPQKGDTGQGRAGSRGVQWLLAPPETAPHAPGSPGLLPVMSDMLLKDLLREDGEGTEMSRSGHYCPPPPPAPRPPNVHSPQANPGQASVKGQVQSTSGSQLP